MYQSIIFLNDTVLLLCNARMANIATRPVHESDHIAHHHESQAGEHCERTRVHYRRHGHRVATELTSAQNVRVTEFSQSLVHSANENEGRVAHCEEDWTHDHVEIRVIHQHMQQLEHVESLQDVVDACKQ